jgi:hypothetical protein
MILSLFRFAPFTLLFGFVFGKATYGGVDSWADVATSVLMLIFGVLLWLYARSQDRS